MSQVSPDPNRIHSLFILTSGGNLRESFGERLGMKVIQNSSCVILALAMFCTAGVNAQDAKKTSPLSDFKLDGIGDFHFHGYARAGTSATSQGGQSGCYGSATAGHYTGRIGDECDTYVEFALDKSHQEDNQRSWTINTRFSFLTAEGAQFNDYQSYTEPGSPTSDADVALREINVSGKGYLSILPSASIWGGKKFYKRRYIDLMDFYYLNDSGYGFGIDEVHTQFGDISAAWITSSQQSYTGESSANGEPVVQVNKADVRFENIKLSKQLSTSIAAIYGRGARTNYQAQSGEPNATGEIFTWETLYTPKGGKHYFVAQLSTHGFGEAAMSNTSGEADNTYASWQGDLGHSERFIAYGEQKYDRVTVPYSFLYSKGVTISSQTVSDANPFIFSAVLSPSYKESPYTETRIEVGVEKYQQSSDAVRHGLSKAMLEQTFRPSKDYDISLSPFIGSFWGKDATENYIASPKGDSGNIRFGIELSAWW